MRSFKRQVVLGLHRVKVSELQGNSVRDKHHRVAAHSTRAIQGFMKLYLDMRGIWDVVPVFKAPDEVILLKVYWIQKLPKV